MTHTIPHQSSYKAENTSAFPTPNHNNATGRLLPPGRELHHGPLGEDQASKKSGDDRSHATIRRLQRDFHTLSNTLTWYVSHIAESVAAAQYAAQYAYTSTAQTYHQCQCAECTQNGGQTQTNYSGYAPPEPPYGTEDIADGAARESFETTEPNTGGTQIDEGDAAMLRPKYMVSTMRDILALQRVGLGGHP